MADRPLSEIVPAKADVAVPTIPLKRVEEDSSKGYKSIMIQSADGIARFLQAWCQSSLGAGRR